jgi:hypothetical protein
MPELRLSLWRVVTTDYAVFSGLVFPVISLIVIIVTLGNPLLTGMLAIASMIALIIAGVRFIQILAIFNENQAEEAVINRVYVIRNRVRLTFEFTYHGEKYQSNQNVIRSKATTAYKPGDRVQVLVDWSKPSSAIILALFAQDRA